MSPADIDAIKHGQGDYKLLDTGSGEELRAYVLPLGYRDTLFGAVITAKSTKSLAHSLRLAQLLLAGGVLPRH